MEIVFDRKGFKLGYKHNHIHLTLTLHGPINCRKKVSLFNRLLQDSILCTDATFRLYHIGQYNVHIV